MADAVATLKLELDKRAAEAAKRGIDDVRKASSDLDKSLEQMSKGASSAERALGALSDNKSVRSLRDRIDAVQDEADSYVELARQIDRARAASEQFGAADERNTEIRRSAGLLGDVDTAFQTLGGATGVGAFSGAGEVFAVAEALPQLVGSISGAPSAIAATATQITGVATSFGTVAAAAGIAGAALLPAAIAVKGFSDEIKKLQQDLDAAVAAQSRYFELLYNAAPGEAEAAAAELETQIAVVEGTIASLQNAGQNIAGLSFLETVDEIPLVGQAIARLNPAFAGYDRNLEEQQQQLEELQTQLDATNRALESRILAIRGEAAQYAETQRLIRDASSETVRATVDDIRLQSDANQQQLDALRALNQQNPEVVQAIRDLTTEQARLSDEEQNLLNNVLPLIEAREREAAAVDALQQNTDALVDLEEERAAAQETLAERIETAEQRAADRRLEVIEQFSSRAAAIEQNFARGQERLLEDRALADARAAQELMQQIEDARRAQAAAEAELITETQADIRALRQDHQQRLQDIDDQYYRDARDAALTFNGRQLAEARRERDESRADAQSQFADERRDLVEAARARGQLLRDQLEQEIEDLRQNFEQRRRLEEENRRVQDERRREDFERQLQQLDEQRSEALDKIGERLTAEIAAAEDAYDQIIADTQTAYRDIVAATTEGLQGVEDAFADTMETMQDIVEQGFSGGTPGSGNTFAFQSGTAFVPRTGLAMLHQGEAVMRPDVAAIARRELGGGFTQPQLARALQGGGGSSITIGPGAIVVQGGGMGTAQDIERQLVPMLERALRAANRGV